MKLWLDDLRPAPEGWVYARTAYEAIDALRDALLHGYCSEISFDHDLGESKPGEWSWLSEASLMGGISELTDAFLKRGDVDVGNGYQVARWIELAARDLHFPRLQWHIHSANPVGRENITRAMMAAEVVWRERDI